MYQRPCSPAPTRSSSEAAGIYLRAGRIVDDSAISLVAQELGRTYDFELVINLTAGLVLRADKLVE
jgi:hypothetical protein